MLLVSDVYQIESVIHTHTHTHTHTHIYIYIYIYTHQSGYMYPLLSTFFSYVGHYKVLDRFLVLHSRSLLVTYFI